ncbi:hypothetical protein FORC52_1762 [Salmonella enterica subsp. enterica serovar Enteritidis]|uniref:Uncharacterized protein n=2 Tax=Salmonella dublin TaxID=98360 RepID=A0A8X6ETQ6_SALDU|nr:hypothetical protein SeD_A2309 [Salmonella enterica subsp. enterica serovar Dublin str. CT_02021853]AET53322.1 hypothetical protein SPUL_0922 [Salmonella enterica subsp. enterica serovar Gallinarum/Pullorum str. RKS5078]AGU63822.1 hypothetical protein SPUCDC_0922 [Salmonella enterica subsp. enterica serovar Gallinarum/Pullorum str. CDC1983-67]ASL53674.1 hypothetical protein FORC52_1762 [Salmonella enterica subsp. enterica serovar Enteritidis]ATD44058.1 hypothetical protein FORC51_1840 [Salmo
MDNKFTRLVGHFCSNILNGYIPLHYEICINIIKMNVI